MPETIFCKHYRAMHGNDTCNAGVLYDLFKGRQFDDRPCFLRRNGKIAGGCDKQEFPTVEEIEAEERELAERFERTGKARQAIVAHLGGPWKKGMPGAAGSIPCPCCQKGELRFSRAGLNGHIHAACTTDDCVCWME